MIQSEIRRNVRHNFTVNVLDGAFFGLALGFASYVTVIPLFVDTLTDSTTLIGLIASIHMIGWNLPQILTANWVAGLTRYRPMVLMMTLHERWPFLGLALIAVLLPTLGTGWTLLLTFVLVIWQALGGGFTATAWQTMIGKIMPLHRRGTFWGMQAAAASVLMAVGGYAAGLLLVRIEYPYNFALCFFLAGIAMLLSMGFLAWTREPENEPDARKQHDRRLSWSRFATILRQDSNLRAFLFARFFSQFGWMAVAFYTIYGKRQFGMDEEIAGVMLAVLTITQTVANPTMGWLGDWLGHRRVFAAGGLAMAASALAAGFGPSLGWLYVAFALGGIGHAVLWTTAMTMTLEFGTEAERPYYIGLVNTLIAPATLGAPLLGGWLADSVGFNATFVMAALGGIITAAILLFVVREPRARQIAQKSRQPLAGHVGD